LACMADLLSEWSASRGTIPAVYSRPLLPAYKAEPHTSADAG
jgi:hypothetical protein